MPQLMTKEEIHEFGLQILSRYLEANAYEIEMMHPNMQMFPHIIAKRMGSLYLLLRLRMFIPIKAVSMMMKKPLFWKTPLSLMHRQPALTLALPMQKAHRTRIRNCAARRIKMLTF